MKKIFKNKVFKIGLVLLVIGSGPLLAIMLAAQLGLTTDPNPNPVIFGMLAMLTFWPGIILMGIGAFLSIKNPSG